MLGLEVSLCNLNISFPLPQKKPGHQLVRVLKAITYERMGRRTEAVDLAETIRQERPTDEHVLSTMVLVYKATGQSEVYQSRSGMLILYNIST